MIDRRTLFGLTGAASALPTIGFSKAPETPENHPLLLNAMAWTSVAYPPMAGKDIWEYGNNKAKRGLTLHFSELIARHADEIWPDRGQILRSPRGTTRVRLKTRYTFEYAYDGKMPDGLIEMINDHLASELRAEISSMVKNADERGYIIKPYMIAAEHVMIDPMTFEPVVPAELYYKMLRA